jgi:hypothetical protein
LTYCHDLGGLYVTYNTGFGAGDWIYWHFIHSLGTTGNYSAIADLHTLQFTVTHALGFLVFTSRSLSLLSIELSRLMYIQADSDHHRRCRENPRSHIERLQTAGFILGSLFDPEDGGSTSLRNVGELIPNYTALHPRWWYSSNSPLWAPHIHLYISYDMTF